jgi:hypothetical protein
MVNQQYSVTMSLQGGFLGNDIDTDEAMHLDEALDYVQTCADSYDLSEDEVAEWRVDLDEISGNDFPSVGTSIPVWSTYDDKDSNRLGQVMCIHRIEDDDEEEVQHGKELLYFPLLKEEGSSYRSGFGIESPLSWEGAMAQAKRASEIPELTDGGTLVWVEDYQEQDGDTIVWTIEYERTSHGKRDSVSFILSINRPDPFSWR